MKNYSWLLIVPFIGLLFFAVWGFTRIAIWPAWNLSASGQIGDTIGGITAPFINLLGAILVYLSFKQQQEANRIQNKALADEKKRINALNKYSQLINLIHDIEKLFDNFKLDYQIPFDNTLKTLKGEKAMRKLNEHLVDEKNNIETFRIRNLPRVRTNYTIFLKHLSFTSNAIDKYEYNDDNSKEIIQMKFVSISTEFQSVVLDIQSNSSKGKFKDITSFSTDFLSHLQNFKKVIRATK